MDNRIKTVFQQAFGSRAVLKAVISSRLKKHFNPLTTDKERSIAYFKQIHNIHRGRRGFVIGNGPSLRLSDLDLLIDEVTIASNKVYLAFDQVQWRPSYYTVADPLVWDKVKSVIPPCIRKVHIPSYLQPYEKVDCAIWDSLGLAGERQTSSCNRSVIDFSPDVTKGLFGSCTITFENLQLAVHLGLDPIYIIGCDHFYQGENDAVRDHAISHGTTSNHFIDGYRVAGELVNPAPIEIMNRGYREARRFSDAYGVKIINATRGGHLSIFERADFNTII